MDKENLIPPKCPYCLEDFKKLDEYTYAQNCKCKGLKDLRISVGTNERMTKNKTKYYKITTRRIYTSSDKVFLGIVFFGIIVFVLYMIILGVNGLSNEKCVLENKDICNCFILDINETHSIIKTQINRTTTQIGLLDWSWK
jgi:hypothetical protein